MENNDYMDGWGRIRPKPNDREIEDVRNTYWYKDKYKKK